MPTKGYPRTRFEVIDNTNVQEISNTVVSNPRPLAIQLFTSDRGPESWSVIENLNDFNTRFGSISFKKYGQPQLNVAEILRHGGAVLGKRLVGDTDDVGNVTVYAIVSKTTTTTVIEENTTKNTTYDVTIGTESKTYNQEAPTVIYKSLDDVIREDKPVVVNITTNNGVKTITETNTEVSSALQEENYNIKYPLFTVATIDRATKNIFINITPIFEENNVLMYYFSVRETVNGVDNYIIKDLRVSLNSDISYNNIPYDIESRSNLNASIIKLKMYPESINEYAKILISPGTNTNLYDRSTDAQITDINTLITSYDILGFYDTKGTKLQFNTNDIVSSIDTSNYKKNGYDIEVVCRNINSLKVNSEEFVTQALKALGKQSETNSVSKIKAINSNFDTVIFDLDRYKIDFSCDAGFDVRIKNAFVDLANARQDFVFLADLKNVRGVTATSLNERPYNLNSKDDIIRAANMIEKSKFTAIYHNTCDIYDPYTKKQINVTLPCLLGPKMVAHIDNGAGKPFAGILNNITFPEIIESSVNFIPRNFYDIDEKMEFIKNNINYISYYDDLPVMNTMYVNVIEYTQLSYLNNIMNIQSIVKELRKRCPKTRYTFMDGSDLQKYLEDTSAIINNYNSYFKSISIKYMADAEYESQNIFYAVLTVQFRNFVQEEYFRIYAIS